MSSPFIVVTYIGDSHYALVPDMNFEHRKLKA